jgi:hypothetical protein
VLHGNTNAAAKPRAKDTETNMMFRASLNMRDEKPRSPAVLRSRFSSNSRPAPMGTTHHGALLKDDEFESFGYFCDFDYMSQNVQKWIERFDLDVRPLFRRS